MMNNNAGKPDAKERVFDGRRRSVAGILGIGALAGGCYAPGKWTKPVVNAVMLPAHAQTSPTASFPPEDPCNITVLCTGQGDFDVIVDGAVEPPIPGVIVELAIQFADSQGTFGGTSFFASTATNENGTYSASNSYEDLVTIVRIIATLPGFPEAEPGICELDVEEPGPHTPYTDGIYFCFQLTGP